MKPPFYNTEIAELAIGVRAANALYNGDILTLDQIRAESDEELLRLPNFGRKSLDEVREAVATNAIVSLDPMTLGQALDAIQSRADEFAGRRLQPWAAGTIIGYCRRIAHLTVEAEPKPELFSIEYDAAGAERAGYIVGRLDGRLAQNPPSASAKNGKEQVNQHDGRGGKLPSHGRGPRFDPLCAHHFKPEFNDLVAGFPCNVPQKSGGTIGAHRLLPWSVVSEKPTIQEQTAGALLPSMFS
ncbi:DNA-directed RNA polymerase subunit alpha C-terminal domain-containing protein [Bradyrhizobium genomosp. III]|uniref:DNA-directed RNA polymerase subunit alpha C-terminal domain-containing protein n=1 Tax=Bradyrhizobium genomosp. III TaxID=2683271 RepID=UPI0004B9C9D9|nr:DNA-directed RNA polymerase subunit alpha C-terminal domain-containing protein [Bradyrhizobium sp. CCBAU 15544]